MIVQDSTLNPYGLPHPTLRPHQAEAIEWVLNLPNGAAAVINAPTGSGKTSLAAAAATHRRVVSLVKTKNLQTENYGGSYSFDVLYGRSNYDCVHPEASTYASAAECMYAGAMGECEVADQCPYLQARDSASSSYRASLNYSYWLAAKWPAVKLAKSQGYLFCDEAHQLSDVTLDYTSVTVSMADRLEWDLPPFPVIRGRATRTEIDVAGAWLAEAEMAVQAALGSEVEEGDADEDGAEIVERSGLPPMDEKTMKRQRRGKALRDKLHAVGTALEMNANDWYLRSGPATREVYGAREPAFVARPLTARYHFPRYFLSQLWTTVMMSATIGDPATFAAELGIDAGYQYLDIPNAWPPESRPVQVLAAPAMGYATRNDEAVQNEQARVIAAAINDCPRDWSGLIHVTRKTEATALAARLARQGVADWRLWTPNPQHGTEKMQAEWKRAKRLNPGALAVTWAMWEGFDGLDEKICIVAKTPFPSLGDEYERERMQYSGAMFLQRTAWQMEQGLGRTRRGRPQDYDNGQRNGLVAIADGNYTRVQKYLSAGLRAALVRTL